MNANPRELVGTGITRLSRFANAYEWYRDCQTSLNSCFNGCFEMFCRNPAKKWQRLPAAATRQDAASTI